MDNQIKLLIRDLRFFVLKLIRIKIKLKVLACLYRAGYDEEKPLKAECAQNVRRVLYERASRVNMLPDVEENCRQALSEYCSQNVQPTEVLLKFWIY